MAILHNLLSISDRYIRVYQSVNPLRPKLLITRKTFKAHGPLKWLKYMSV